MKYEYTVANFTKIISKLTHAFYSNRPTLQDILTDIFLELGTFFSLSRVYYFSKHENSDYFQILVEWVGNGISHELDNPELKSLNIKRLDDIWEQFLLRQPYNKNVDYIKDINFQKHLKSQNIASILLFPVLCNETIVGFVGFDYCYEKREWKEYELSTLEIVSENISGYFSRKELEWKLENREKEIETNMKELSFYKFALDAFSIIAITDLDGVVLYVNDQFEKLSKYSKSELLGNTFKLINSGHQSKEFYEDLWQTISSGKIWKGEIKNKSKNGEYYWVQAIIIPYLNEDGKPYRYITLRHDITEKKSLELKIQAEQNKLKLITENTSVYIFEININGLIMYANRPFLGRPISELLGQSFANLFKEEFSDSCNEKLRDLIQQKEPKEFEASGNGINENDRWFINYLSPVLEDNKVNNVILVSSDLTLKKSYEKSLEIAKTEAERMNRMKSDFIANMSHELRTPLNGVIGFSDLLENTPLNALQKEYVKNVNTSANSLLSVISDILDFSKIEAGKLEIDNVKTDIYYLIEQIIDITKYQADKKGLEFLLNMNPNIPRFMLLDPTRLKQVILNLLSNSIKFTEKGEVELIVDFKKTAEGQGDLSFIVRDTGIGIDESKRQNIFQAFSQADSSTTRKYGGTGLGLTISKILVELMGGNILLDSKFGEGSKFYFSLPVQTKKYTEDNFSFTSLKRVLIVDDNKNNCMILERVFGSWDIEVEICNSGERSLSILKESNLFDLILMDFNMPDMDGLTTINKIQSMIGDGILDKPIILMCSTGEIQAEQDKLKEYNNFHYLLKPVKIHDLKNILLSIQGFKVNDPEKPFNNRLSNMSEKLLKIIIADDVDMNILLIQSILNKLLPNAVLFQANTGSEVIKIYQEENIDLIFMDIIMPEMDGLECTRVIRRLEQEHSKKRIPIFALTAGAVQGEREKCLESGMDDFLLKPLEISKIKYALGKWLFRMESLLTFPSKEIFNFLKTNVLHNQ